jgi:hypothetical protein
MNKSQPFFYQPHINRYSKSWLKNEENNTPHKKETLDKRNHLLPTRLEKRM